MRKTNNNKGSNLRGRTKCKLTVWLLLIIVILLLILAAEIVFLCCREKESSAHTEFTQETIPETVQPAIMETAASVQTEPQETETTIPLPTQPEVKTVLPQYAEKYEENNELFGWLKIENTKIDFPVMHTPEDPEKYLHKTFEGFYRYGGTPFIDAKCSADSDNMLIYGHNMKDGSMFHDIIQYEAQSYWEAHPVIIFNTLYEEHKYEILAAFYDRVYYQTETCFKFYKFIDAKDEADYGYAVSQFKEKALYDTGVEAVYGDKLITLVTCSYHVDNGRFVVVAVQKDG